MQVIQPNNSALSRPTIQDTNSLFNKTQNSEHLIEFNGFSTWIARSTEQKQALFRLRHKVYCEENNWVEPSSDQLETDEFDEYSTHLAVTNPEGEVIATIRHTDSSHSWMVERFFRDALLGDLSEFKNDRSCEASRMALDRRFRSKQIAANVNCLDMLLAGVYFYTKNYSGYNKIVLATLPVASLALQRRRTPLRQLGPILTMEDGCKIGGYEVDLSKVDHSKASFAKLVDQNLRFNSSDKGQAA